VLLRELSDEDENAASANTGPDIPEDPKRPWLRSFRAYLNVVEQVPDGWSAVKWWGVSVLIRNIISQQLTCTILEVNFTRYHPAWASLARNYLSVMSSSVSSERAFSQGRITISKQQN
jgi:hypothetical protein